MKTKKKRKLLLKIDKKINSLILLNDELQEQISNDYQVSEGLRLVKEAQNKLVQLYDIVQHQ